MKFSRKKEMPIDGLKITKFLSSGIYQYRFVKVLLIFVTIIHALCQILQMYLFLHNFDLQEFIQYGPLFFIWFYGMTTLLTLLLKPKLAEHLFQELYVWSIDSASKEVEIQIRKEMKIIEISSIIFTICTVIFAIFISMDPRDYDMYLPMKFVIDYVPKYSKFLRIILKIAFALPLIPLFQAHCYQVVYYTQHIKYQLILLIDHINEIMKCSKKNFSKLKHPIDNLDYQREIKQRLVFSIRRHQELLTCGHKKIKEISNLILCFSLFGLIASASLSLHLVAGGYSRYELFLDLTGSVLVGVSAANFLLAGQSIETTSYQIAESLQQIDWYDMNCENRKLYLTMFTCAQRPVSIKFSETCSINYSLGLTVIRGIYAVVSAFVGMQDTLLGTS